MDKWDEIVHRIQQSILAEEPEAAVSAGLQLFAEFGRTLEQLSADTDRIATALENPEVFRTQFEEDVPAEPQVHDL